MGKFADLEDVTERYVEGTFPAASEDWAELRITDVEADLILMVPSLDAPLDQISPIRLARAKSLVADKVLELFRNPSRARTRTQTAGPYSESSNFNTVTSYDTGRRSSPKGYFTEDEVATLRLRGQRSNLGVAYVKSTDPFCR